MRNSLLKWLILIICTYLFNCVDPLASGAEGILKETVDYTIWWALSGKRIMKETLPSRLVSDSVQIYLARNEAESFQVVVRPKRDLHVQLRNINMIEGLTISCNTVGFVRVDESHSVPDILYECGEVNLKKGENAIFWMTARTDSRIKAGDYRFTLRMNGDKISVHVHIFDFTLPIKPTIDTLARIWWNEEVGKYVEIKEVYKNLKEHRIHNGGPITPSFKVTFDELDKRVEVDFRAFDQIAEYLLRELEYNGFIVPFFFGNRGGLFNEKWLNKLPITSPEFEKYFGSYCAQVAQHLKEKGWIKKAYMQLWDEPVEKDLKTIVKIARVVKRTAPGLKVYITTPPRKELYGLVDAWSVLLQRKYFDATAIEKRQQLGEEIWGYQNDHFNYLSHPLHMRLLPWLAKKYNLQGIEWWAINRWDKYFGVKPQWKAGNGVLLYLPVGQDKKPLNSIRWELYRDGLEDADYLSLLEKKAGRDNMIRYVDKLIKGIDPEERVVDPQLLDSLRIAIGKEIERLSTHGQN